MERQDHRRRHHRQLDSIESPCRALQCKCDEPIYQRHSRNVVVAGNTPTLLEFGRFVHLALHQYVLSIVLGECVGTERDSSATGVPHRGESDGVGGGVLGEKRVHGSGTA